LAAPRWSIAEIGNCEPERMQRYLLAKLLISLIFLFVFYCGVAALRSGKIRWRGRQFDSAEDPFGYWLTVIVTLVGPAVVLYLLLTR